MMLIFFCLWTLFVLYPNPYRLVVSIYRTFNPPVDVAAVALIDEVPEDPREIEDFVLDTVPYEYNWQTYGVPFYFPTPQEVIAKDGGDCKSRFILLASLFEAKGIPYQQSFSLSHFWIDYEGKESIAIEQEENALLRRTEEGFKVQLPQEELRESAEALWEGFWIYMPLHRKILFLLGFPMTVMIGFFMNRKPAVYGKTTKATI